MLLPNGKILLVESSLNLEIYDPATEQVTAGGSLSIRTTKLLDPRIAEDRRPVRAEAVRAIG